MRVHLPGFVPEGARQTDEWLTPPWLLGQLGDFDLDPCTPLDRPWDTATRHYTADDDGLVQPWAGRVWLNPPYSTVGLWMERMAGHGDGVALVFARTDTTWWQRWVWPRAQGFLFLAGRLAFVRADGRPATSTAAAPSALVAYGRANADALRRCALAGARLGPAL